MREKGVYLLDLKLIVALPGVTFLVVIVRQLSFFH